MNYKTYSNARKAGSTCNKACAPTSALRFHGVMVPNRRAPSAMTLVPLNKLHPMNAHTIRKTRIHQTETLRNRTHRKFGPFQIRIRILCPGYTVYIMSLMYSIKLLIQLSKSVHRIILLESWTIHEVLR